MRFFLLPSLILLVAMPVCAQDGTTPSASSSDEIKALRQELTSQRELIRQQQRALETLETRVQQMVPSGPVAPTQPLGLAMAASTAPVVPGGTPTHDIPESLEFAAG